MTRAPRRYSINVIEDGDNRILLLRRAPDAGLGAGLWGFCAGHIETEESPLECSARELREELGGDCRLCLLKALGPVADSYYGGRMEIHLFHYRWEEGQVQLNSEHTAYAWVDRTHYRQFPVMDGIDEDLAYFGIWPRGLLNPDRLPR